MKKLLFLTLITATAAQGMDTNQPWQQWQSWLFGGIPQHDPKPPMPSFCDCDKLQQEFADFDLLTPDQQEDISNKVFNLPTKKGINRGFFNDHYGRLFTYLTVCKQVNGTIHIRSNSQDSRKGMGMLREIIAYTSLPYTCNNIPGGGKCDYLNNIGTPQTEIFKRYSNIIEE